MNDPFLLSCSDMLGFVFGCYFTFSELILQLIQHVQSFNVSFSTLFAIETNNIGSIAVACKRN